MEHKQRTFLLVNTFLVVAFVLILAVLKSMRQSEPALPTSTKTPNPTALIVQTGPKGTPPAALTPSPAPTLVNTKVMANEYFVSPDGQKSNTGKTRTSPWPLQFVLDGPEQIQPGDTVWLMRGKYTGPFRSDLKGEQDRPITIRALPGERVTLESADYVLDIRDSYYVNFWGLEIAPTPYIRDPHVERRSAYGVRINQSKRSHNIKFINMIVHDMPAQGFGWWDENWDSEIYGTLIFHNGIDQLEHGIYVHNIRGTKKIVDNFIFNNASHGIHAYGERDTSELDYITIEGNTLFNNGSIGFNTRSGVYGNFKRNILLGGYSIAADPVITENYTYYPGADGEAFNLGYRGGSSDAVIENNYFAGGQVKFGGENENIKMVGNTIVGFALSGLAFSQNTFLMVKPSEEKIFVRPNQYDPGRANITIYNWGKKGVITLTEEDLAGINIHKGDRYELRSVQDYFDDVVIGVYNSAKIEILMNNRSVAQPVGLSFKPKSTFPEFGTFILQVLPEEQ